MGATEAHENEPINRLRLSDEEAKSSKTADLEKSPQKVLGSSSFNSQRNTFDELIENLNLQAQEEQLENLN